MSAVLRSALEKINEWCCYASEEAPEARPMALQQIGMHARAALSAQPVQEAASPDGPGADAMDAKRLREALEHAALALENTQDTIASWGGYASPYFQQKHDLEGDIEHARVASNAARAALGGIDRAAGTGEGA